MDEVSVAKKKTPNLHTTWNSLELSFAEHGVDVLLPSDDFEKHYPISKKKLKMSLFLDALPVKVYYAMLTFECRIE